MEYYAADHVRAGSMQAGEAYARGRGARSIAVHVFGHNITARRLYESLGYEVTHLNMAKPLPD